MSQACEIRDEQFTGENLFLTSDLCASPHYETFSLLTVRSPLVLSTLTPNLAEIKNDTICSKKRDESVVNHVVVVNLTFAILSFLHSTISFSSRSVILILFSIWAKISGYIDQEIRSHHQFFRSLSFDSFFSPTCVCVCDLKFSISNI